MLKEKRLSQIVGKWEAHEYMKHYWMIKRIKSHLIRACVKWWLTEQKCTSLGHSVALLLLQLLVHLYGCTWLFTSISIHLRLTSTRLWLKCFQIPSDIQSSLGEFYLFVIIFKNKPPQFILLSQTKFGGLCHTQTYTYTPKGALCK